MSRRIRTSLPLSRGNAYVVTAGWRSAKTSGAEDGCRLGWRCRGGRGAGAGCPPCRRMAPRQGRPGGGNDRHPLGVAERTCEAGARLSPAERRGNGGTAALVSRLGSVRRWHLPAGNLEYASDPAHAAAMEKGVRPSVVMVRVGGGSLNSGSC